MKYKLSNKMKIRCTSHNIQFNRLSKLPFILSDAHILFTACYRWELLIFFSLVQLLLCTGIAHSSFLFTLPQLSRILLFFMKKKNSKNEWIMKAHQKILKYENPIRSNPIRSYVNLWCRKLRLVKITDWNSKRIVEIVTKNLKPVVIK